MESLDTNGNIWAFPNGIGASREISRLSPDSQLGSNNYPKVRTDSLYEIFDEFDEYFHEYRDFLHV